MSIQGSVNALLGTTAGAVLGLKSYSALKKKNQYLEKRRLALDAAKDASIARKTQLEELRIKGERIKNRILGQKARAGAASRTKSDIIIGGQSVEKGTPLYNKLIEEAKK